MPYIDRNDIRALTQREDGVHLSLFMPTAAAILRY